MKVCQALKQNDEEVRLYVPGRTVSSWQSLQQLYGLQTEFPIEWIPVWKPLKYLDYTPRFLREVREWHADLVYTRMLQVARLAALSGMPVILELHDLPSGRFGLARLQEFLRTPVHKRVVFITRSLRQLVEEQLNSDLPEEEVIIAPDGVDLERYADLPQPPEARRQLHMPERITALYSGSFYHGRGLQTLFELAQKLRDVQFVWVGGSPEDVEHWNRQLADGGITNVVLTGFVDNAVLPLYQSAADLLLMPYDLKVAGSSGGDISRVTSPMKLFEYMACGRPILTSDLPVLHEVLNPDNAVFCPPDDLESWIGAITALSSDAARRQALAAQALHDVQAYSWRGRMEKIMTSWNLLDPKVTDEQAFPST
jgi:glycosyltransferase involved in cell wall biosynthesis